MPTPTPTQPFFYSPYPAVPGPQFPLPAQPPILSSPLHSIPLHQTLPTPTPTELPKLIQDHRFLPHGQHTPGLSPLYSLYTPAYSHPHFGTAAPVHTQPHPFPPDPFQPVSMPFNSLQPDPPSFPPPLPVPSFFPSQQPPAVEPLSATREPPPPSRPRPFCPQPQPDEAPLSPSRHPTPHPAAKNRPAFQSARRSC